jgi:hypothetical protein
MAFAVGDIVELIGPDSAVQIGFANCSASRPETFT